MELKSDTGGLQCFSLKKSQHNNQLFILIVEGEKKKSCMIVANPKKENWEECKWSY